MTIRFLFGALAVAIASPATALDAFSLTCRDISTYGFRSSMVAGSSWTTEERFFGGPWEVVYEGGDDLVVDGRSLPITVRNSESIIAVSPSRNGIAVSLWAYAINLATMEMTASQVNSFVDSLDAGVKSRAVQFSCSLNAADGRP